MKLRLRSVATGETIRIDAPDPVTLLDIKSLLSTKLASASATAAPIPADSIHLSLNRADELVDSSAVTSGDLVYFSFALFGASNPNPNLNSLPRPKEVETTTAAVPNPNRRNPIPVVEVPRMATAKEVPAPSLLPPVLKQMIDAERANSSADSILARFVLALHAAFLDTGFVICSGGADASGMHLPQNWASKASYLSVKYTVPELRGSDMAAMLNYTFLGSFVVVYGNSTIGTNQGMWRLCVDEGKIAPLLNLDADPIPSKEEKEIFGLWNLLKDGLCLPLKIDLCLNSGLPLPPCFMQMNADIKARILDVLVGSDLARTACTCRELKFLSYEDGRWKRKYEEEFGSHAENNAGSGSWKAQFARAWLARKEANRLPERRIVRYPDSFRRRNNPLGPQRFMPIIGGDYDLNPMGREALQRQQINPFPARRNFSPSCNLGGSTSNFFP